MKKRLTRREFARTSLTASAAAAFPNTVLGSHAPGSTVSTAQKGAALARERRALLPPPTYGYGGDLLATVEGARDSISRAYAQSGGQSPDAPEFINGWRVGTTLPVEYYVDEKHYVRDEKYLAENFWLLVDHHARIPRPNDYFVFASFIGTCERSPGTHPCDLGS